MKNEALKKFQETCFNIRQRVIFHYTERMFATGQCMDLDCASFLSGLSVAERAAERFGVLPLGEVEGLRTVGEW